MQNNKKSDSINILDLLMYLISKWKWFLVSVVVCVGAAWLVYSGKPFVYFTSSTVIIKDPSNKTSSAGLDRYDNFINRVNVANEILQFQSKKLITEVVQRVRADVSYKVKDHLRYRELYTQSPVAVSFPDATPARNIALTVIPFNDDVAAAWDASLSSVFHNDGYFNGKRYGFPSEGGSLMLLYINTDAMVEAGLDPVEDLPETLDELYDLAVKLTKRDASGNIIRSGFQPRYLGGGDGVNGKFMAYFHNFGARVLSEDLTTAEGYINSDIAVEAFTWFQNLCKENRDRRDCEGQGHT